MLRELTIAFGIMGVCLVIHLSGMVALGDQLVRRRQTIERRVGPSFNAMLLFGVFVVIIMLHFLEALLWAAFYVLNGLFDNFETSLYFSLNTYSTVGYGDVLLPGRWRVLGTIEAISGVLLCGLSTAFLFAIITALFRFRTGQIMKDARLEPAD
jgi:Ion channel